MPEPTGDLAGRVALVTGGTLGIGAAVAQGLATAGASVMICGTNLESLQQALRGFRELGLTVDGRTCDVSSSGQVRALVRDTRTRFGGIDVLVNSAGIQRYGTALDTTIATWDRVFDVNVKGMFLTAKHVIPEMRRRGGGSIVNIASVQSVAALPNSLAYVASKGAITAMTRAMALDHAPDGIRVNAVCPGSIDTPMLRWAADQFRGDRAADDLITEWGETHPIGRIGEASDVAALVLFLASEASSFITGASIPVDGGLLASLGLSHRPRPRPGTDGRSGRGRP